MTGKIKELPKGERPYERCEEYGPECLTDAELLSVILRNGSKDMNSLEMAREILKLTGPERTISGIEQLGDEELLGIPGLGRVKLIEIRCLTEYSKRLWKARLRGSVRLGDPDSAASFFMEEMRHLPHEEVRVVVLNSKSGYISSKTITRGLCDRSLISPREVYSYALKAGAAQIIIIHNHPSGDPTPSKDDIAVTEELIICGAMIGIRLADSLIIGDGVYVSLRKKYGDKWEKIKEIIK